MATHWENGDQRHFMKMLTFERLENCFTVRILLTLSGRQHSERSEEQPVQLLFAQQSSSISIASYLTGEGWFKVLPTRKLLPLHGTAVHLLGWLWRPSTKGRKHFSSIKAAAVAISFQTEPMAWHNSQIFMFLWILFFYPFLPSSGLSCPKFLTSASSTLLPFPIVCTSLCHLQGLLGCTSITGRFINPSQWIMIMFLSLLRFIINISCHTKSEFIWWEKNKNT